MVTPFGALHNQLEAMVVGRQAEIAQIAAALRAGCDLLLEGPPGTSKSTLLRAVAQTAGVPFRLVEGSADLTPARLVGSHNPAAVLAHGYRREDFVLGPLPQTMRDGGLLYIEEFNRVPDDTLNLLLGPLAERSLHIPRYGVVRAAPGFRLIAAMNPFDNVGTLRVSQSVFDRLCRLPIGYQSAAEELAVVTLRTGSTDHWLIEGAINLTRATRDHPDLQMGSSVRGAIDLVCVAEALAALRGITLAARDNSAKEVILDAALLALSARISLSETATMTREAIIRELWANVFYFIPQAAQGDQLLDLEVTLALPRQHNRPRGPVTRPRPQPTAVTELPRRGTPTDTARVFRPDELALLMADRSSAPAARRDLGRTPGMSQVLKSGQFDPAAFGQLYVKDEDAAMALLGELWQEAPDEQLRALTRRLALKIVVRLARRHPTPSPGKGRLRPVRYHFNSDDLDLDRTLEEIAAKSYPEYSDFWVRERVRTRRTYVLLLDVSGSMRGAQLMKAALAAGSMARNLDHDDLAVVLFWRDAAVLKRANQPKSATRLIDEILGLRARGLTNLHHGLAAGLRELERAGTQEKIGIVFTDGLSNLGDDPLPLAARYPQLHVIGISLEASAVQACQALAARGRGRCVFIRTLEDIPLALSHCMV
ncbi:MAG: AAA family ATPase [Oscillochloridaceae bacterium umkhey_bin13]